MIVRLFKVCRGAERTCSIRSVARRPSSVKASRVGFGMLAVSQGFWRSFHQLSQPLYRGDP